MAEEIGGLHGRMSVETQPWEQGLNRARQILSRNASSMTQSMGNFRKMTLNTSTALNGLRRDLLLFGGISGIGYAIKRAVEFADELDNTSKRLGLSAEALQEIRYAARQTGVEIALLETGLTAMVRRAGEAERGNKTFAKAFEAVGLSARDLASLNTEEMLKRVADGLARIPSEAQQIAVADQIFSEAGRRMINLLRLQSGGLEEMAQKARSLGIVLSNDMIKRASQASDQLDDLGAVLKVVGTAAALELVPAIRAVANIMTDPQFTNALKDFGTGLAGGVDALVPLMRVALTGVQGMLETWNALPPWVQEVGLLGAIFGGRSVRLLIAGLALSKTLADELEKLVPLGEIKVDVPKEVLDFSLLGRTIRDLETLTEDLNSAGEGGTGGGGVFSDEQIAKATQALSLHNTELTQLLGRYRDAPETVAQLRREIELETAARQLNIDATTEQGQQWIEEYARNQELTESLKDVEALMQAIQTPQEAYNEKVARLNDLLEQGSINAEQYARGIKLAKDELDSAEAAAGKLTLGSLDLKNRLADAFTDAAVRGEKLSDVLSNLAQDLAVIVAKALILQAIGGITSNLFGGGGGGSGGGSGIASALGKIVGIGVGGDHGTVPGQVMNHLGSLPKYARGGGFRVGGVPGLDANLVSFWATRGEEVSVAPAGGMVSPNTERADLPPVHVQFNIESGVTKAELQEVLPIVREQAVAAVFEAVGRSRTAAHHMRAR